MLDPKKLLEQFMGGSGGSGGFGQAPGGPRGSSSGDILGQLGGLASGKGGGQGGLGGALGQVAGMARNNPMVATAIMAALLRGKGIKKLGGSAVKLGGLAAIAGLGYMAYKNYQAGQAPGQVAQQQPEILPPPAASGFDTDPQNVPEDFALSLVRAMIAAANADGHIDQTERHTILSRLEEAGLGAEERAFIEKEIANPADIDTIVKGATTEQQKIELYTASRLAIDPDTRAERGYLDQLAGRLNLPDALVDHIEATVKAA